MPKRTLKELEQYNCRTENWNRMMRHAQSWNRRSDVTAYTVGYAENSIIAAEKEKRFKEETVKSWIKRAERDSQNDKAYEDSIRAMNKELAGEIETMIAHHPPRD